MAQDFLGGAGAGVRGYKERVQADLERALGLAGAGIDWGTQQLGGAVQSAAEGAEAFRRGYEGARPTPDPSAVREEDLAFEQKTEGYPAEVVPEDFEFERRLLEAGAPEAGGLGPAPMPPYPPAGSEVVGPELSKTEQAAAEMEALKESLGFEWATEVDPRTGRPAQPRTVNLAGPNEAEQLYTPPKESRGGNVSVMSHPEQGQLEADTRTMSPTQLRAHFEDLSAMAEAQRLGGLVEDPYAPVRAEAGAEAGGKIAVERGKIAAETEATREQQAEYIGQLVELQNTMHDKLRQLAASDLSSDEKDKRESEIRAEVDKMVTALQIGGGMARRTISAREDLVPEVY